VSRMCAAMGLCGEFGGVFCSIRISRMFSTSRPVRIGCEWLTAAMGVDSGDGCEGEMKRSGRKESDVGMLGGQVLHLPA
jgi:hypothetical protein